MSQRKMSEFERYVFSEGEELILSTIIFPESPATIVFVREKSLVYFGLEDKDEDKVLLDFEGRILNIQRRKERMYVFTSENSGEKEMMVVEEVDLLKSMRRKRRLFDGLEKGFRPIFQKNKDNDQIIFTIKNLLYFFEIKASKVFSHKTLSEEDVVEGIDVCGKGCFIFMKDRYVYSKCIDEENILYTEPIPLSNPYRLSDSNEKICFILGENNKLEALREPEIPRDEIVNGEFNTFGMCCGPDENLYCIIEDKENVYLSKDS